MSRAILYLNEIIVMIVTAPILMATGVASNSILVTLAPCLALGLTARVNFSLTTFQGKKNNHRIQIYQELIQDPPAYIS